MFTFFLGITFIAFVIGLLTGISNSPVVSTVAPLIFSLLTAGGIVYVGLGESNRNDSLLDRVRRFKFLGLQLIFFSIGFILGGYIGVWCKFNSDKVWPSENKKYEVAFKGIEIKDFRVAYILADLDYKYFKLGLPFDERQELLTSLNNSSIEKMERKPSKSCLSKGENQATASTRSCLDNGTILELQTVYEDIKKSPEDSEDRIPFANQNDSKNWSDDLERVY